MPCVVAKASRSIGGFCSMLFFFLFGWWIQGWRLDLYAVQRHLEQNSGWLSEGLSIERRHRKLVFSVTLDDISIYFNFQPPIDEEFLQSMFVGVV